MSGIRAPAYTQPIHQPTRLPARIVGHWYMLPANGYLDASSAITSTIAPTLIATSGQPQNSAPPTPEIANPYSEKSPANSPTPAKVSAPLVSAVRARLSFPAAVANGSVVSTVPIR